MKRTQIYLDDAQDRILSQRARGKGCTKSALIREAIDRYIKSPEQEQDQLARFKEAVRKAAGTIPDLPDGATYVRQLRELDLKRERELYERWRQ